MDNGPEFSGAAVATPAESHGVNLELLQPGKTIQNPCVRRFDRIYKEESLD